MTALILNGKNLTFEHIYFVAHSKENNIVRLCPESIHHLNASRDFISKISQEKKPIYGITTGLGALSHKSIDYNDLKDLQVNLVRSHCAGVGKPFSREITRAIMLLRANCLILGHSGVNPSAVELLLDFINYDITPLVPEKGSVGASGDLAPLAHIALCLIGEGEVLFQEKIINSQKAIKLLGKNPLVLGPKDGLALVNGTAVMAALGSLALYESKELAKLADIAAAMSLDAIKGSIKAFDPRITSLRPHPGQVAVSKNLNAILQGSEILKSHKDCAKVQDPYSLRCVPQVHGASRQTIKHVDDVFSLEINSVTDNPLVFVDDGEVLSGGNFHGAPLALAMDYLAMGISEFGSISERRIEKMMNKEFSGLPPFLAPGNGLHSGLMIAQVTAASLASENKILCHPASIDSIPTSTDKEDHVSMGVTSGRKLLEILFNVKHILAVEFLCNTQAIDLRRPLRSSPGLESCHALIRSNVLPLVKDRVLKSDIDAIVTFIKTGTIIEAVENQTEELL